MGKSYMQRRQKESDFFETPYSLTEELLKLDHFRKNSIVLEPASGNGAITRVLRNSFKDTVSYDLLSGTDFFKEENCYDYIITNPPFTYFDDFVLKAKQVAKKKFAFIAKANFLGAYQRVNKGVWQNLKHVYIFDRQVDYRGRIYEDGSFHVGGLVTGWFIWDMSWKKDYWMTSVLPVNKYATRGQVKKCIKCKGTGYIEGKLCLECDARGYLK